MTHTILVPIDNFDEHITELATIVNNLCLNKDSKLVLLHVVPDLTDVNHEEAEDILQEAEALLQDFAALLDCDPQDIHHSIQMGDPAQEILKRAIIDRVDNIAMPTRGASGLNRILAGSVTEYVIRHAPCPVVATRKSNSVKPLADKAFRHIMVPLDGSAESAAIVPTVVDFARLHNASVTLFYDDLGATEDGLNPQDSADEALLSVEQHIKDEGIPVRLEKTALTNPADEIVRKVDELGVDIVAMTTHGRTGLSRMVFGSVAEEFLHHSNCPLLTLSIAPTASMEYQEKHLG